MKTKEKLVSPAYCRLSPCLPGKVVWKAKGLIGGKQKMSICADPFFGFRSIFFGVLGVLAIAMGTSDGQIIAQAPVITSEASASAKVGAAFSYQIVASNSAKNYRATGLPRGLAVHAKTGSITGVPTAIDGSYNVTLTATNAGGTGNKVIELTVAPTLPLIAGPVSATGSVGRAFNYKIAASNFARTYGATGLPSGLSVNATSGIISGVPADAGNTTVVLSASNGAGTATKTIVITIMPLPPVISNSGSASGNVGVPFSYQIVASHSPTSYSATGLPRGLTINKSNGIISGTPLSKGYSYINLIATNAGGSAKKSLALTVTPTLPLITSAESATGTVGSAFIYKIVATGFARTYGATGLPSGLSVNATSGDISGVPAVAGNTTVVLSASNDTGTATKTIVLTIMPLPPVISISGSASGNVGVPFSYQIVASHSPTSYSATGLPGGLEVHTKTGLITGTPTDIDGSYNVTLTATNAGGMGNKVIELTVAPTLPLITSEESATGTVGSAFIYKIVATGFARTYGATGLPSGLSVNATSGDISGVPEVEGNTTVVLSASNGAGTATKTIVLTIMPLSPVISNSESASGNVGVPFSYQIVASHSPTSYSATGLPRGLMINESNGMISGVPVAIGNSTVVLTAMNSGGSATKSIALKIVLIRLAISDCTLPSGDRALPYAGHTFTASGGVGGNSWSVIDGILPLGMTLNASTGKLAGTPTIAGSFTFVLRVEDASHSTDEVEVVLDILPTTFHRPPFSWNKVPIYKMFGDGKRLLSDAELNILAGSLDFLCIEKSHGLKELGCAKLGAAREIARFKKIDPKICGLFYFNSAYAYPFTTESKVFGNKVIAEPFRSFLLLDPQTGQPKRLGTVPMFDVLKPEFRTWWAETIGKGVRETGADGVFVDQMHGFAWERPRQRLEVAAAQAEMMRMAKKAIGPEKILLLSPIDESPALFEIGDAFMFEHYNADQLSKEAIVRDWDVMKKISSAGKISVWRIGVNKEPEGAKFVSGAELEKFARKRLSYYLAAFLIGAQPYSYFQYNWGWTLQDGCLVDYPEFSKPLGAPKAEATRPDPSAWIFTREFEKASVRVDLATGQGEIHWH